jgi:murein DD-endopeptidase MepM/ murein hydrolase activator NlpD
VKSKFITIMSVILTAALGGCERAEKLRDALAPPTTAHQQYAESLQEAGLGDAALGRSWLGAATEALRSPVEVSLPFREAGYISADSPRAPSYLVSVTRGQRLDVTVSAKSDSGEVLVFLDLFLPPDSSGRAEWLESAPAADTTLSWEAEEDRSVLLRLQPELLESVRYTVTIQVRGALEFPVAGRDGRSIQSRWGAARDAGARRHEGIDIFAARGTPVLAAAPGIARVGENQLGGHVIFVRNARRGISIYYAHLDSQIVSSGERVEIGDTIGLVGNTGNARTTPPHLHFGIYARGEGARDPFPYIFVPRTDPPALRADTSMLGDWLRVSAAGATLFAGPDDDSRELARLPRGDVARASGAAGGWYAVALPDGSAGYVDARRLVSAERPLKRERARAAIDLRDGPGPLALIRSTVPEGTEIEVLGSSGEDRLVRVRDGEIGWMRGGGE